MTDRNPPPRPARRYLDQQRLYAVPERRGGEMVAAPNYHAQLSSRLHALAEGMFANIPGERLGDELVVDMAALAEGGGLEFTEPPCLDDAEPLAVDRIRPAVVDVLNAITTRLEELRDGGPPERADGVTEGEAASWRLALNRAITLTSSSALIASGVGTGRRTP